MRSKSNSCGLVLSGGGARAAYQVGVLRAVAEILGKNPFQVLTGESAGAINATFLAARMENFEEASTELWKRWEAVRVEKVFHLNPWQLAGDALFWAKSLFMGGTAGQSCALSILDSSPLREFIGSGIDFTHIPKLIKSGKLNAVAVSATNYATGSGITFFDSNRKIKPWANSQRASEETIITLDHVMASTSLPVLFPPVKIQNSFFGDGSIRLKTPLSPAIHLGANKIFAVGIRYRQPPSKTARLNEAKKMHSIYLADIAGVILNAGFLDNLSADVERAGRINEALTWLTNKKRDSLKNYRRTLQILSINPSQDPGEIAAEEFDKLSYKLRFFTRGLGMSNRSGWDMMSYLAFDPFYTKKLLELGYKDGMSHKKKIKEFFASS
jgi:NTE family protein